MKLFSITRPDCGYDDYDGFVVAALKGQSAIKIVEKLLRDQRLIEDKLSPEWIIKELGVALPNVQEGILLSSFHAG